MGNGTYKVVFEGKIADGHSVDAVKDRFAAAFRKERAQVEPLFSGKKHTLKTVMNREEGERFAAALGRAGVLVDIVETSLGAGIPKQAAMTASPPKAVSVDPDESRQPGITGAALSMALMPAAYALLTGTVAVATLAFTVTAGWIYGLLPLPLALLLHLLPAAAGLLATALLAKPLLPLRNRGITSIELDQGEQTELFEFVEYICDAVDAPHPGRIYVDASVGASVSLEGASGFWRKEPVLRIGLPLMAATNMREFGGVLAHELGRFSAGAHGRGVWLIRAVDKWISDAVNEPDLVDDRIAYYARHGLGLAKPAAQLVLVMTRWPNGLLVKLLEAGRAKCRAAMQQVELEAALRAATVTGSKFYKGIVQKQRVLQFVASRIDEDTAALWRAGDSLDDSLAHAVTAAARGLSKSDCASANRMFAGDDAGFVPPDSHRFDYVRDIEPAGFAENTSWAKTLVTDFDKYVRRASFLHYRNRLGLPVTSNRLRTVSDGNAADGPLNRFFLNAFNPSVPLKLGEQSQPSGDHEARVRELKRTLVLLRELLPKAREACGEYDRAEGSVILARQAEALLLAGGAIEPELYGLPDADIDNVHEQCRIREETSQHLQESIAAFNKVIARRLLLDLSLLGPGRVEKDAESLLAALKRSDIMVPNVAQLRTELMLLEVLLSQKPSRRAKEKLHDRILEKSSDISQLLMGIRVALKSTPSPFEGEQGRPLLGDALKMSPNADMAPAELLELGAEVVNRFHYTQRRILGRLAQMAAASEKNSLAI